MLWLSFILLVLILFLVISPKSKKIDSFFNSEEIEAESFNAVNLKSLVERKKWQKFGASILTTLRVLGPRSSVWASFYIVLSVAASWYIVITLLMIENKALVVGLSCVFIFAGYRSLVTKRRRDFENTFPDALNILMSAVSAGDSLMQAIIYVGDVMDNAIGREFKRMGDRFKLGESPDVILHRACKTYPYPEFLFFTVTIRANIARGGQLKGVLARLIRVLGEYRKREKKKTEGKEKQKKKNKDAEYERQAKKAKQAKQAKQSKQRKQSKNRCVHWWHFRNLHLSFVEKCIRATIVVYPFCASGNCILSFLQK